MDKVVWKKRGDQGAIAREVGIGAPYLSDILAGRKVPSPRVASALHDAAKRRGYKWPIMELLYPSVEVPAESR